MHYAVLNPKNISIFGLASSAFARHYSRNLVWFLFLRVLRCFSSPRSLRLTMYSLSDLIFFIWVVSQFGNLRIEAYLQLPAAYRSLSRPSSAPDAKAFTLCSLLLELLSLLSIAWVSQIIFTMKKLFLTLHFHATCCAFCFLVRLLFRACGQIVVLPRFSERPSKLFC